MDGRFDTSRNFLATDEVPKTIFGIPVVSRKEDYTEEDLAFFREHPEAGGYYDLEGGEPESQADEKGGDAVVSKVNRAIAKVIPFLKEEGHEGFRPAAYQDSVGKWTVGYGQTEIRDPKTGRDRPVAKGDTISEKDASAFVEQRVRANAAALHREHPGWSENLSDGALAALYDVAYNMGTGALSAKRSPNLNSELDSADMDHDSIVWRELPSYSKAGGKTLPGLLKRRNDAIARWRK